MDYPKPNVISYDVPPKYGDRHVTTPVLIKVEPSPPPYNIVFIQSQPIVLEPRPKAETKSKKNTTRPVELDENPRKHLCMCERGCERCVNCVCCMPDRYSVHECPTKCTDISSFRVKFSSDDDGVCCGVICFPITLFHKLVLAVPCVSYNVCRNVCSGTSDLDYIP